MAGVGRERDETTRLQPDPSCRRVGAIILLMARGALRSDAYEAYGPESEPVGFAYPAPLKQQAAIGVLVAEAVLDVGLPAQLIDGRRRSEFLLRPDHLPSPCRRCRRPSRSFGWMERRPHRVARGARLFGACRQRTIAGYSFSQKARHSGSGLSVVQTASLRNSTRRSLHQRAPRGRTPSSTPRNRRCLRPIEDRRIRPGNPARPWIC